MHFIVDVSRPERPDSFGVAVVYSTWVSENRRTCFLPPKKQEGTNWLKRKKIPTKNESVECCPIYRHHLVFSYFLASWQEARKLLGAALNETLEIALSNQYGKGSRPSMARKIFSIKQ